MPIKINTKRIMDTKRGASSPLRSYLWYVELPANIPNFNGDVFELNSRIMTINNPYNNLETDKEIHGNSFWYFAKNIDIGNITLEIMEHEDGRSFEYFKAWEKMIANNNGTFNPPAYYKRDIKIHRLDEMKNTVITDVYSGYFVSGVADLASDYETNGFVRYSITLTGDSVTRYNSGNTSDDLSPEQSKLADISQKVIDAKEFIDKVQEARISKRSLIELFL